MRKAKVIAAEVNEKLLKGKTEKERNVICRDILVEFLSDVIEIEKERKIDSSRNMRCSVQIIKELNQKWNALCRRCNYFRKDAFKDYVLSNEIFPEGQLDKYWNSCLRV